MDYNIFLNKIYLNVSVYNFYSDFLEYKREFFVFDQKIIQYQDIIQCTLHRNLIQKEYDLYTIKLATANTEAEIQNIKEAEEVYQFIKAGYRTHLIKMIKSNNNSSITNNITTNNDILLI